MSKTIRAVLFDVGHTILFPDEEFFFSLAVANGSHLQKDAFCWLGARAKEKAYRSKPENPYKMWFTEWMLGSGVRQEKLPDIFDAIIEKHNRAHLWNRLEPTIPVVFKELREKGLILGVISNADGTVRAILEKLQLDFYFKCIIDSHEVGVEKPDARIFHLASKEIGIPPENCMYVGDQIKVDVEGAAAVGMQPVLLDPYGIIDDAPCPKIRCLQEVVGLVGGGASASE